MCEGQKNKTVEPSKPRQNSETEIFLPPEKNQSVSPPGISNRTSKAKLCKNCNLICKVFKKIFKIYMKGVNYENK